MRIFKTWTHYKLLLPNVVEETDEVINFEPFIMENIKTKTTFPSSDKLYYEALEAQLVHLLYKFQSGWISSPRQVMYNSDECISNVHFVMNSNREVTRINVFQRSSNLFNLKDDIQFFNYFKKKHNLDDANVTVFISAPHVFKNKMKKIEDQIN